MTDRVEAKRRVRTGLRQWFRTPPRAHGETEYTREVSFLELFYDLVYVVLIARVAHHLAEHVDWGGVFDFAVVFGLVWYAWFNGTFWHELHSREDGRSRNYIFAQMMLLSILAVFAEGATGNDGPAFAITYAVLFVLLTWQWYQVHRIDDPAYHGTTTRYLVGMLITVAAVLASAVAGETFRLWIWAAIVVLWTAWGYRSLATDRIGVSFERVTASLVERLGLFTIIVLGEVVVGVVDGIGESEDLGVGTIATGVAALTIGFGLWWNYFDALGRRIPERDGGRLAGWLFAHLPLAMAIAAGGAAMLSLVEHAADSRTPAPTAWLLSASVTVALLAIALAVRALPDGAFPDGMIGQVFPTFVIGGVAILIVGAARPAPLVMALLVAILLLLTWLRMFVLFLAAGGVPRVAPANTPEGD